MWNVRVCRFCPVDAAKLSIDVLSSLTAIVAVNWHEPYGKRPDMKETFHRLHLALSPRQRQDGLSMQKDKREQEEKSSSCPSSHSSS